MESKTSAIESSSGKALLVDGAEHLHTQLSTRMETAMGRSLHRMEVRFHHLNVSADVILASRKSTTHELPTIANAVKKSLGGIVTKKNKITKQILHDVSGVFKPGTMTLVLGQPGSGKSSLMKILSGRFPQNKHVKIEGDITYNGTAPVEIKNRLSQLVSYVPQRDHHLPTLTVKETLEFAHQCCGGVASSQHLESLCTKGTAEENQAAIQALRSLSEHHPDVVIQQLGLEKCQDTVVGDAMLRGVSGGERKRVTTGEMLFGSNVVSFMDEISTGLDSAATFDIIKTQRSVAKNLRKTVVIALLQPSPEVFALFDDVLILNDGHVMYHGPRETVNEYFRHLGFERPESRDVADYLLDLGTHQQHQYEVARSDGSKHPRKAREFGEIFRNSLIYQEMLEYINGPLDPELLKDQEELVKQVPDFHQSFWPSTLTLVKRELRMMSRNSLFFIGHFVTLVCIALLYSTAFWQVDPKNPQVVLGLFYGTALYLGFVQNSQLPVFMATRETFYRQRGANFYRSSAYAAGRLICQIPVSLLESVLFSVIAYWMCGFVISAPAFFVFVLILFLNSLTYMAMHFLLVAAVPDLHVAEPCSMVIILISSLSSGFIMAKDQIPDYLIWLHYINPVAWIIRSLAINQYRNAEFDVCEYDGIEYCERYNMTMSEYTLSLFSIASGEEWLWYGVIFLVVATLLLMSCASLVLEYKRYDNPHNTALGSDDDEQPIKEDLTSSSSSSGSESDSQYNLVRTPRRKRAEVNIDVRSSTYTHQITPVTLAFRDLWYSVPNPADPKQELNLLKGINGFALPGKMTALMGSSGAGKTTLMDVIAGRKSGGKIRGQILLNGHEATDLTIRRATGYCEQMDIHAESSTIREALTFSAFLRQDSSVPASSKYDSVEECLDLLGLRPIADQIVRGSSVEQIKRLTIGVELAAQPSVLFLDEPTSGLDARSAKLIMAGIRKVADTGRTVVCTIHQPSTEVFLLFDNLLLLKRGGQTVYFGNLGENGRELIQHFEEIPGVTPIEEGYNPSTWMLEVIGAGVGNTANDGVDFVEYFNSSEKAKLLEQTLSREGVGHPVPGVGPLLFESKRAASEWTQAKILTQRFLDLYWRTPSYNISRALITVFVGLICGIAFLQVDYESYQGINAGQGLIFLTTLFSGATTYHSIIPFAMEDRASFYRERASETYNTFWYFVGATVAEVPYVFFFIFFFNVLYFPMAGFSGAANFFLYWLGLSLHVLTLAFVGQLLAFAFPTVEIAGTVANFVNSVFLQFMGFSPPSANIPSGYHWLYVVDPSRFSFSVLSATAFGDCPSNSDLRAMPCHQMSNLPPTVPAGLNVKEYVAQVFSATYDRIGINIVYMLVAIFIFRTLALLSMRFINHQKK
ncbi:hypothetical protein Poli38472_010772 [Pythium oligandrum]|uniref:ABC transporter domain-containing protein n=1 Tax=Pythium oligandrum TaxID=41045 RepID=A0A8K1FI49_PYTOL|nr:hypothetical protein Poli38472_010772 [Pythium oligandrum]|eukprot:TMW61709.1 hypothetical protein Poli38472_010772 [Pythium oligandrum]